MLSHLKIAFKNVLRNKRRALITIIVAAVGTAAIIIGGGFALFTYDSLIEYSAKDTGHLILSHPQFFETEEEKPMSLGLNGYKELENTLKTNPEVQAVLPRVQFSGLLSNGEKSVIFSGTGVDPEEFKIRGQTMQLVAGRLLNPASSNEAMAEVILGKELAKSLKSKIGDTVTVLATNSEGSLAGKDLVVKGIVSTGVSEVDKRLVFVTLSVAQKILSTDKVSTTAVHLFKTVDTDAMKLKLQNELSDKIGIHTWLDQAAFYLGVKGLYDRIFGLLGLIIAVLVFFAVSNTISMAVTERTREIGALRAMGTYGYEIIRDFFFEGVLIGIIGTALGSLVAGAMTLFLYFVDIQMPPPPGRSVGYQLYITFSGSLSAVTALCIILLCGFAAYLSSRKAIKKQITEALNYV